jgi:hypothetical protein
MQWLNDLESTFVEWMDKLDNELSDNIGAEIANAAEMDDAADMDIVADMGGAAELGGAADMGGAAELDGVEFLTAGDENGVYRFRED